MRSPVTHTPCPAPQEAMQIPQAIRRVTCVRWASTAWWARSTLCCVTLAFSALSTRPLPSRSPVQLAHFTISKAPKRRQTANRVPLGRFVRKELQTHQLQHSSCPEERTVTRGKAAQRRVLWGVMAMQLAQALCSTAHSVTQECSATSPAALFQRALAIRGSFVQLAAPPPSQPSMGQ